MKKILLALLILAGTAHADGMSGGFWVSKTPRASAPTGPGITGTDRIWFRLSTGHAIHTDTSNIDHDLDAAAAGGSPTIGGSIVGGSVTRTLYVDGGGNLAQSSGLTHSSATAYSIGGTPSLAASLSIAATASFGIGDPTHVLTTVATAKLIGGASNTSGHTVPNVADDTLTLLSASQTLASKTLTAPIINGATSSGSTSIDFSGNSGAFKTPTGSVTVGPGSVTQSGLTTFSGGILASGANAYDFSGGSGAFKTSTGSVTMGPGLITQSGQTTFSGGILASGANTIDFSGNSGAFKTSTGVNTFGGSSVTITNKIGSMNGESTAGVGTTYIERAVQDVASSGAGAQSTTITSGSFASSGVYRVSTVCSNTTADTVSTQVTYTDAVNSTALTLTMIGAAALGANSTASSVLLIRATTALITLKISNSSQATTKCSGTIERLS